MAWLLKAWNWLRGSRIALWIAGAVALFAWWKTRLARERHEAVEKRDREAEEAARKRADATRRRIEDAERRAEKRQREGPDGIGADSDLERLRESGRVRGEKPGKR